MGLRSTSWLGAILLLAVAATALSVAAQPPGPATVGVTAARSAPLRSTATMAGTVEARVSAVVASLVAGPVVEVLAREGDRVRRGDLLVRLRREDIEQDHTAATARLAEVAARLQQAEQSSTRMGELSASGVVSQQRLDDAKSEVNVWRGSINAAKAEIARLEVALRNARVRAPFSGVVVAQRCELGEWIEVGGPVVEIVDLSRLEVVVSVPERHFATAVEGASAVVRVDALPGLELVGKIVAVIPRADRGSRAFPVKVAVDNSDGNLAVGMSATVELVASQSRAAVLVPKDALLGEGPRRRVFRLEETADGAVARVVEVELGSGAGAWIAVLGLQAGDRVVTRGNERLMAGMAVEAQDVEYPAP